LADKQILAWILKYTLEEFKDYEITEIISRIGDDIEVSQVPLDAGQTNLGRIKATATEDNVPNEGKILYDIRFTARYGEEYITILINVEAQKSSKSSKLGYHLDNRIIFYLSRMVSAQKQTEFFNSDFDSLKKVRSIWLCMDADDDGDSISEIYLAQKSIFGKGEKFGNLGLMKAVVIHIRENDNVAESKNGLIAMLEDLVSKEKSETKKEKLKNKYGLVMTETLEGSVDIMCNWSDAIEERGMEIGMKRGEERGVGIGTMQTKVEQIVKKIKRGKTTDQIADELEENLKDITPLIEAVKRHAPEYNVNDIVTELFTK
jgi:hypothetical protein